MGRNCYRCGKGIMMGRQHKHHPGVAGGRWKKRAPKTPKLFKPNLHYTRIMVSGNMKRVRLCTKCLRIEKENMKDAKLVVAAKRTKTTPSSSGTSAASMVASA